MPEPYIINEKDAARIAEWLNTRGGIAIWRSINLSNPGASWTTPALNQDGTKTTKPNWQSANQPERMIVNPAEVSVSKDIEVKRFRVGIRVGGNGMQLKVTDGGSRRIRSAVAKAGDGAYHHFDYSSQECVIYKPEQIISLPEWLVKHEA
jgi:hypothetical protein